MKGPATITESPLFTVILLSWNQSQFLEESILSVIGQSYKNVELIIVDGGSTDGSVDIIKKYEHSLAWWTSERDSGQTEAYLKALPHCTGEIMTIHASDDKYFPWAFDVVVEIFSNFPQIELLTSVSQVQYDRNGRAVTVYQNELGYNREAFLRGKNAGVRGFHSQWVQTSATFWRRALWDRSGVASALVGRKAADFCMWGTMMKYTEPYSTLALLGGERFHAGQTIQNRAEMAKHLEDILRQLEDMGGRACGPIEAQVRRLARKLPKMARLFGWPCKCVNYDVYKECWKIHKTYII